MAMQQSSLQSGNANRQHEPWNILQFFSPSNNGPWVPPILSNTQPRQTVPVYANSHYDFPDYRSAGLPSECGTAPNDSGYSSSHPTYSIVESASSIHDDDAMERYADSQNMAQLIGGLDVSVKPSTRGFNPTQGQMSRPPKPQPYCHSCNITVKTKSELKKHEQRHRKPFRCQYKGCPKSAEGNGFSTPNDLTRHKKTVHKEHNGNGAIYICHHDPCNTKKPKPWPRADNFRSHLLRTHGIKLTADDDLSRYMDEPTASKGHDLQGVGSQVAGIDADSRPTQLQDSPGLRGDKNLDSGFVSRVGPSHEVWTFAHPSSASVGLLPLGNSSITAEDEAQFIKPNVLESASASGPLTHDYSHQQSNVDSGHEDVDPALQVAIDEDDINMEDAEGEEDCEIITPSLKSDQELVPVQPIDLGECKDETSESCASDSPQSSNDLSHPFSESQIESLTTAISSLRQEGASLQEFLKALPRNFLEDALKRGGMFKCTQKNCDKKFARQCELKKHIKRHEKPYGCTYRLCSKVFGSKNDWKRHESSQHYLLETWNCDVTDCDKFFARRDMLRTHLQKEHNEVDVNMLEEKLESCRLGRHCDPRFWCGFCAKTINNDTPGSNSWTKRCDHIDNHLFGKEGWEQKPISEWRYLEDEVEGDKVDNTSADDNYPVSSQTARRKVESQEKDSKKRKREDIASNVTSKRPNIVWICCHCGQDMALQTSRRCMECQHEYCKDNCKLQSWDDQDLDVEPTAKREKMA